MMILQQKQTKNELLGKFTFRPFSFEFRSIEVSTTRTIFGGIFSGRALIRWYFVCSWAVGKKNH